MSKSYIYVSINWRESRTFVSECEHMGTRTGHKRVRIITARAKANLGLLRMDAVKAFMLSFADAAVWGWAQRPSGMLPKMHIL